MQAVRSRQSSVDCCMPGVQSVRDAASSLSMMSDTAASKSPWKGQTVVFFEWSSCQFIVFSSRVWRDVIRFIGSQCTSLGTSAFDSAEVRRKACRLFHHLMWKFVVKTLKNNLWCYSMWVFGSWDIWCCYVSFFFSDPLITGVPWTSEYSHLDVRLLTEVLKSLLTNCFDCEVRPLYPFQRHNSPFLRKPKLRDGWTVLVTYVWGINGNIYLFD